ncbi:hypothetical protein AB4072_13485 [Microvirga sp. 2MCAF38]|uniref:hypothetical protein n=1 Tax=Microvirga sp. 2MCAF38 TaxID=3232989 RepID=UPI003F992CF1
MAIITYISAENLLQSRDELIGRGQTIMGIRFVRVPRWGAFLVLVIAVSLGLLLLALAAGLALIAIPVAVGIAIFSRWRFRRMSGNREAPQTIEADYYVIDDSRK